MAKKKDTLTLENAVAAPAAAPRYVDCFVDSTEHYKPANINAAIKKVLQETESEYILFTTPALELYPDETQIEKALNIMDAALSIGALQPVCEHAHAHLKPNAVKADSKAVHFVQTYFLIIRREALIKAGLFNERFTLGWGADIEWSYRMRKAGFTVCASNFMEAKTSNKNTTYPPNYQQHAGNEMTQILNEMFPDPNIFLGEFANLYDVTNFWGEKKK